MSARAKWVGFSAVAVAVLLASCSGDDGDGDGGNQSGSSNAGTSNAGAGNKAGSGGSGTGGNGTSGSGTGGSANNAGRGGTGGFSFGGSFNLGGAGFDPEEFMCDPAPTPGTDCDSEAQPCLDGTEVCYCAMGEWACMDLFGGGGGAGPGGQLECPDSKPADGSPCDAFGVCPYGGQNEGCACDGSMWTCTP